MHAAKGRAFDGANDDPDGRGTESDGNPVSADRMTSLGHRRKSLKHITYYYYCYCNYYGVRYV